MDRAHTEVKWPKWALAVLFLVDGAGFGTWAAHVPVFKQFLHIENGSLTFVLISVIVGAIISMPVTGQLIARYGSRRVIRNAAISYVLMIGLLAQASSSGFLSSLRACLEPRKEPSISLSMLRRWRLKSTMGGRV
jgi:MFS family permease